MLTLYNVFAFLSPSLDWEYVLFVILLEAGLQFEWQLFEKYKKQWKRNLNIT